MLISLLFYMHEKKSWVEELVGLSIIFGFLGFSFGTIVNTKE